MTASIRKRWPLLLIIAIFVAFKVHHLTYPFFWDESIPYNVAITAMYHHGPSLMPNAIDPELYRGHPTLFISSAAVWMHLFGTSHIAEHSFALLISVLLLVLVYESCLKVFDRNVAILATLLTGVQVEFVLQSSFMLPEVMVALFSFASIYYYSCKRYLLAGLALAAVLFSKESGIVSAILLGGDAFVNLFNRRISAREKTRKIVATSIPVLLIGGFFLLQKKMVGWYFFPLHNQLFVANLRQYTDKFRVCLEILFTHTGRHYYSFVLFAAGIAAFIRTKKVVYLMLPLTFICMWGTFAYADAPTALTTLLILLAASGIILIWLSVQLNIFNTAEQKKIIVFSLLFLLLYCAFSAANFFTPRYIIAAIVPLMVVLAALFGNSIKDSPRIMFYLVVVATGSIAYYNYATDRNYGDTDPGAFDGMAAQQSVVTYLEQQKAYDKFIGTGSYLEGQHLSKAATGFLSSSDTFRHVAWDIDARTDYAIFDNIEPEYRYPIVKKDSTYKCVHRFEKDGVWSEVWQHLH
jgi:Dolichyl-phosphate-mannose-protein mannosyltransferase